MKYSFSALAVAVIIGSVAAADPAAIAAEIPSCAIQCIGASVLSVTNCNTSDFACQCKVIDTITSDAIPCIVTKCTTAEQGLTLAKVPELCAAVAAGAGAGTTTAATTTDAPTTAATTTAATTTAATTTAVEAAPTSDSALANLIAAVPSCAVPCIEDATASKTDCAAGDFECSCKTDNQNAITGAASTCVYTACGAAQLANVLAATGAICTYIAEHPTTPTTSASVDAPTSATVTGAEPSRTDGLPDGAGASTSCSSSTTAPIVTSAPSYGSGSGTGGGKPVYGGNGGSKPIYGGNGTYSGHGGSKPVYGGNGNGGSKPSYGGSKPIVTVTVYECAVAPTGVPASSYHVPGNKAPSGTGSAPHSTGSAVVPVYSTPAAPSSSVPVFTGAATNVVARFGSLAAVAVAVFAAL